MAEKKSYLVKPFDVLFFRDNKAFDFGEWYSEGIFPPYPSTFQGLIRTTILARNDLIEDGKLKNESEAAKLVGNDSTFPFEIEGPFICDGQKIFLPTPKDIVEKDKNSWRQNKLSSWPIKSDLGKELHYADEPVKSDYLHYFTKTISNDEFNIYREKGYFTHKDKEPYETEEHTGIKLDSNKKTEEHHFYLTPYTRFSENAGMYFTIRSTKNNDDKIKLKGLHGKLGSEGRGVVFEESTASLLSLKGTEKFYNDLVADKKFKFILLTPGIFENGWLPFTGNINTLSIDFNGKQIQLKLSFVTNDRPLRISGYSQLKQKQKGFDNDTKRGLAVKPQVMAVPAGSVYYFKIINNVDKDVLKKWLESIDGDKIQNGIYSAMGYNQIVLGKII